MRPVDPEGDYGGYGGSGASTASAAATAAQIAKKSRAIASSSGGGSSPKFNGGLLQTFEQRLGPSEPSFLMRPAYVNRSEYLLQRAADVRRRDDRIV